MSNSMVYRPCIIIPIYNNQSTIEQVVSSLLPYNIPIYVVDDGSDEATRQVLSTLKREGKIRLLSLPQNQGKGGALTIGFANAYEDGFTHALQLDADGQHDAGDVPAFLEAGAEGDTLVLGDPEFDETAPKARLYGRRINHPWVWFETGSFAIRDALCGYRLYPLKETVKLSRECKLGNRMEFDPEIAVRLVWRGVKIRNVKTKVRYFPGGVSHFRTVRDNARITWLHTRLVVLALFRHLAACFQGRDTVQRTAWMRAPERGTVSGLVIMLWVLRALGPRVCKAAVYPITLYFLLTDSATRKASSNYLTKVLGRVPSLGDLHRHLREFGNALVDKVLAWSREGYPFRFSWSGKEEFDGLVSRKQGAILLSAHLGNIEVLRAASGRDGIKVNAIMFTENAKKFEQILEKVGGGDHAVRVIPTEEITPELILQLKSRIEAGEFVAMLADRVLRGSSRRYSLVPFLGSKAAFPHGPFILASLLKAPCYTLFATSHGREDYQISFALLSEELKLPRKGRDVALEEIIERYVKVLEKECRRSPYQWFNFFDVWEEVDDVPKKGLG